jgi:two-component system OmpR family response regulator
MSTATPPFAPSVLDAARPSEPRHILAIDDEAPILELLSEYLIAHGYRVSTATNAAEANRIVEREAPQLIISDLQLADTDGLKLIEQFRVLLPNVPVILLTGVMFDNSVVEENLKWKVSAYVSKTAPLQTLLAEVRRLLR